MPRFEFFLILVFVAIPLGACRSTSSKPTEQDTIAIYQTVIKQMYRSDDTFGGALEKPALYIVRATNDSAGDPSLGPSEPVLLSETVQEGISDALADLPTTVIWVDSFNQVKLDPAGGFVSNKGVIITLGNINYENKDKALVSASIYVANLAAGGKTYILEKQNGIWAITGTTGVEWIS